jgi:HEAT repeat protein
MTNCPVCGKAVDPIRAPAVGVRDGKVVSYCSREHALEAESRPVIMPVPAKKRAASEPAFRIPDADQKKNDKAAKDKETKEKEKAKQRTPASGVAQPASLYDSGPVIEIIHEPASGVVTSAPDARSTNTRSSPSAEASGAIQIADTGHLDDYVSADDKPGGKGWIWILVAMVLGGGAFAAYELGYLGGAKKPASHVATPPVAVVADAGVPDAVVVAPSAAIAKATVVLQHALASDSPRVQRIAASALARTGDTVAITALVAALAKETSDLAKLDILYALARGGDKRGSDGLVAALDGTRRDVKAEAARRLALLGDKRAIPTLSQFLEISQLSLGAAEQLAFLADPKAIKALEAVRADDKAAPDEKARAAIALGYANKADIAPALHALLTDPRQNAFAAAALANLHDPAGRPILVKQLEMPSLSVHAARALRQLEPSLDAVPPTVLAGLTSPKDTERLQAAETVLLLAGPAAWSAHE